MLRLASDEDVDGHIIRGLIRRAPNIDLLRAQDLLGEGTPDSDVLAWASEDNRILISNDRKTMIGEAKQRINAGTPMPGLILTSSQQSIGSSIDDILLIADCLSEEEIRNQIVYLPFYVD